jgi:MAGUK p55 subfamily protein 5
MHPGEEHGGGESHREMAVDVPDSFIPRNKTPPRYPPTNKAATIGTGTTGRNGNVNKPIPPPRSDKDGSWNNNNVQQHVVVPQVQPRTSSSAQVTPNYDQVERIRKYQEELKKRKELEEKHAQEEEFLRTSLRGSKKLRNLEAFYNNQEQEDSRSSSQQQNVTGYCNDAYDYESLSELDHNIQPMYVSSSPHHGLLKKPIGTSELVASLQRVQEALKKNGMNLEETVSAVGSLMQTPEFQQVLAVHNKVQDIWCFNSPPTPASTHLHQLVQDCMGTLYTCSGQESSELISILGRINFEGVTYAHDKIAEREALVLPTENTHNYGQPVDDGPMMLPNNLPRPPAFNPPGVDQAQQQPPHERIKVVRIEKTSDPLGATVRNEGEAVIVGRIVKGGVAERSGLLHEGDEILEVNDIELRGKSVNDVCDILSHMSGTLTFLVVPAATNPNNVAPKRDILVHVRAHFDYDPEDDLHVPCRELGIAFSKGDILHVISQEDSNWWQAHREGEEDQALAGLIPSKSFQEQREMLKQSQLRELDSREKPKRGTLLCPKPHKKKKKKISYSTSFNDDFDSEEIPTYEEVSLYYPRTSFRRPVVLIGPPNIGRHELRQRLLQDSERFAAAVPHTSRPRKDGEMDGQDYHFITRSQFEADILGRKFVEHGEFEKAYYGTSLDGIRSVVNVNKICVLNLHPQSIKILRNSDLKPYIVFITPPSLERLKQMRIMRGEAYKEEELIDIIQKAREMEEKYGHYFDVVFINNDVERTYHELLQRINYIEREPQWVPTFWLSKQ